MNLQFWKGLPGKAGVCWASSTRGLENLFLRWLIHLAGMLVLVVSGSSAMLRRCPTRHNQKDPQLEYTTMYWGVLGRRRRRKKEDWQHMLGHVPIQKKKKLDMLDQKAKLLISMVNYIYLKFSKCIMFSLVSRISYLLYPLYLTIFYLTNLYLFFRFQFRQPFLQEDFSDSSRPVELLHYFLP